MASTPLGGVPLIDPTQLGKAATADSAFQALDSMINGMLTINAGSNPSPYTVPYQTGDEPAVIKTALRAAIIQVTGSLAAGWTAIMPNDGTQRLFIVQNNTTGGQNVTFMCKGQTGAAVAPGTNALLYLNGTDVVALPLTLAAGTQPWDVGNFIDGSPTAGQVIMRFIASRTVVFPANFANNQMKCGTPPGGNVTFNINKNGTGVGTATIAALASTATWASTGGLPVTFNAGDICTFIAPNPPDSVMADLEWVFSGTR